MIYVIRSQAFHTPEGFEGNDPQAWSARVAEAGSLRDKDHYMTEAETNIGTYDMFLSIASHGVARTYEGKRALFVLRKLTQAGYETTLTIE